MDVIYGEDQRRRPGDSPDEELEDRQRVLIAQARLQPGIEAVFRVQVDQRREHRLCPLQLGAELQGDRLGCGQLGQQGSQLRRKQAAVFGAGRLGRLLKIGAETMLEWVEGLAEDFIGGAGKPEQALRRRRGGLWCPLGQETEFFGKTRCLLLPAPHFVHQPALTHPGLAIDDHDASELASEDRRQELFELLQFRSAPNHLRAAQGRWVWTLRPRAGDRPGWAPASP